MRKPAALTRRPPVPAGDILAPDGPFALQVEITSHCNLRCRMCPLTSGTSSTAMSPGAVDEVVWNEMLRLARRARQVFVAGFGEPLTNRRCIELLRQLDDHDVQFTLVTNGLALTPAIAEELASMEGLAHVDVSIDSPDPDVYRSIRGGNLRRALAGLANLMAAMPESRRARVSVSAVALRQNLASLPSFPALLRDVGVGSFILQGSVDYNSYSRDQHPGDLPDMAAHLDALRSGCDEHGIDLVMTMPERTAAEERPEDSDPDRFPAAAGGGPSQTRQCMLPWEIPYIDRDGKVFPCCYAGAEGDAALGDLREREFDQIWRGTAVPTLPAVPDRGPVPPVGAHQLHGWGARREAPADGLPGGGHVGPASGHGSTSRGGDP